MAEAKRLVLKIGSSSVTGVDGRPDAALMERIAGELTAAMHAGWDVVVVSSGAVTAGWSVIGDGKDRPDDPGVLQAISAIGQHRLMSMWADAFSAHDYTVGQVLLARLGEADPEQYLNAQQTFAHLFDLGVVPIINENDAVADDEIRFGDNDRLAALVAHLIHATHFVMLTDAPGLLTADPRIDAEASLIEIVTEIDRTLEQLAGGPGEGATGGMASKLAAARIATWSGVETIIADARTPGVIAALDHPETLVGTTFRARTSRLSAHKLWILTMVLGKQSWNKEHRFSVWGSRRLRAASRQETPLRWQAARENLWPRESCESTAKRSRPGRLIAMNERMALPFTETT